MVLDLEKRLEELAEAHAAGRVDEAELARRREELLQAVASENDPRPEEGPTTGAGAWSDLEARAAVEEGRSGILEVGMVIGPPEHRVRLLHDLSGKGRIWLARVVSPERRESGEPADDFRAIKIFLPTSHAPGPPEPGRDERGQRADLIGLRAFLTKVRARVELALKLAHPNIAGIHGWRHGADGWPFVEMEYADPHHGHTLNQLLMEQGPNHFSWDVILGWLRPVTAALDYARREHRFAHQHLGADTIFITDQGTVKLLGFGLASEAREPRSILFGSAGPVRGAAAEGSAESVSAETTFRRDVFALALLVYQLLAGRSPHDLQRQSSNLLHRPPGLTDDAWRVLRQGLAYPSELCPTDAGKFLDDLAAVQGPASGIGPDRGPARKRRWAWVAGLVLAATLGSYWLAARLGWMPGSEQPAGADVREGTRPGQSGQESPTPPAGGVTVSIQEAEREADLRAFEAAKRVDTLVAYRLYLQRCPRCAYGQEAHAAARRLESQDKIDKLKADFETLTSALEREGREDQGDEALSRLNALAAQTPDDPLIAAGRRRLVLAWAAQARASLNGPDLPQARKWLKKIEAVQPEFPELAALTQTLARTEAAQSTGQQDAEAFAAARRANTRTAYWTYLGRCATACGHRAEAEAALARLTPANPVVRDRLNDGSQGPEMVVIPAGSFLMGSPPREKGRYEDEPLHSVRIEKPFAIGKYEVMFHEYDRFAAATGRLSPNDQGWGRGRRPVITVNWRDAAAYAEWLSQQTGHRYRLPTESEWEYATRAGTTTSRYWGDDPDQGCAYANAADLDGKQVFVGWTVMKCRDGFIYTAPAGSYRSNDFGLHDMAGNVLEWTCSLYDKSSPTPAQRCEEPAADRPFVVRGGSWNDEPRNVRSAERHRNQPDFQDYSLGFRLVRELP
jgi:formylglycine-generating enzyme required for sulfatase activity